MIDIVFSTSYLMIFLPGLVGCFFNVEVLKEDAVFRVVYSIHLKANMDNLSSWSQGRNVTPVSEYFFKDGHCR